MASSCRHDELVHAQDRVQQPLSGWVGHARPFEFESSFAPAAGIQRFMCGTPAIVSVAALEVGGFLFPMHSHALPGQAACKRACKTLQAMRHTCHNQRGCPGGRVVH